MFVTTAPFAEKIGCSGVKMRIDAELLHEPAFLRGGIVVAARHRAGMADGARQLVFQRPTTHATTGFVNSASSS